MKIGIIGAGSMGSLFGGLLAQAGNDVVLVELWREHVDAVTADGLRMTCEGQERTVHPRATVDPAAVGTVDLIMFWCKGPSTASAVEAARPMIGAGTIGCTLQNGLGNPEVLANAFPTENIVYGVTEIGATIVGPGHIELTPTAWDGGGATYVGTRGNLARAQAELVAEVLSDATVRTTASDDVDRVIWGKLTVACPIAPSVAVARLPIGRISGFDDMRPLLEGICREVVEVANASGITIDADTAVAHAFDVWDAVANHVASMGGDVLARRATEIESINGAIAERGRKVGVATPLNDTMARLVRLVEANYDHQLGVR